MNKTTASDELAVLQRILHVADRRLHIPPLVLVTWGLCAAIVKPFTRVGLWGCPFRPTPPSTCP